MRDEIHELRKFRTHVLRQRKAKEQGLGTTMGFLVSLLVALGLGVYYHRHVPAAWFGNKPAYQCAAG